MIGKLTDALIECANLEASTKFYVEKLGLQVQSQGEGWVCLSGGGASVTMWQGPKPSISLGFSGADLAKVKVDLEAKGISVGPLEEHPGGKHYSVKDPDGNVVVIANG